MSVVLAVGSLGAVSLPQLQQTQTLARTGLIVGRAVDAATGRAVPEAEIRLNMPVASIGGQPSPRGRVIADGEGRFFFAGLPAGSYNLTASKPGYAEGRYGVSRPPTAVNRAPGIVPFELADGQRAADVVIRLWKFAAITGTVTDELGEPVAGATVRVLQRLIVSGRPRLIGGLVSSATTDDRGIYRISSVPPGQYVVVLPSTLTTMPGTMLEEYTKSTGAERTRLQDALFGASPEITSPGNSRNQQIGSHILMTTTTVPIPPGPQRDGAVVAFQTTYYPSLSAPGEASVISVAAGEERSGVNMQLRGMRTVRVSGKLVGPLGPVPQTAMRLTPASLGDYLTQPGFDTATAVSDASGEFLFIGVPPGDYVLKVVDRQATTGRGNTPSSSPQSALWATEPIKVGESDLSDVVVTLRQPSRVTGRFEFRGTKPAPPTMELGYLPVIFDPVAGAGSPSPIMPTVSTGVATFETALAGGRYTVRTEDLPGWWLTSVTVNEREIGDGDFDATSTAVNLVIAYTDNPTRLSGSVRNAQGTPDPTATVLAYSVVRASWTGYNSSPRHLQASRASAAGAYSITNLPPGEYFVVAIPDERAADWQDPKSLEALSRVAMRVTLGAAEQRTLDLRVSQVR